MASKTTRNERNKLYLVGALAVVAAIMAYVRFGHHRHASAAPRDDRPDDAELYAIPALPEWLGDRTPVKLAGPQPYVPPRRDLFAPEPAPGARAGAASEEALAAGPKPVLNGIMLGAQDPQAVVDGKVVHVGNRVGRYTVAAIGPREVVLTVATNRLVLTLAR
jgi:hypothetical protein